MEGDMGTEIGEKDIERIINRLFDITRNRFGVGCMIFGLVSDPFVKSTQKIIIRMGCAIMPGRENDGPIHTDKGTIKIGVPISTVTADLIRTHPLEFVKSMTEYFPDKEFIVDF
jgi:hypothetical protein